MNLKIRVSVVQFRPWPPGFCFKFSGLVKSPPIGVSLRGHWRDTGSKPRPSIREVPSHDDSTCHAARLDDRTRTPIGPIGFWASFLLLGVIRMPTIERRAIGDGTTSYRVRVRLKGAPTASATFARKTDATKWAQSTEAAIREGRYFRSAAAKRCSLDETIDRYLREVLPRKPRNAKLQARQLAWWKAQIGHLFLADVTASVIADAREKLLTEPADNDRPRGPATANRYMAAISHVLTIAVREWELLDTNVARKLSKLREPRGRDRFLSEEECSRLLAACRRSSNSDLLSVVLVAISTGMRRNEILSLRYDQIDLSRGLIYLYDTKNGDRRGVPLAGPALELMQERLATKGPADPLVFAGRTGVTPFDIRKPWARALKDANLQDVRFHDLRHTAASFLAKGGASLPVIGAVLGHKSPAMTKRYSHFANSHLRDVVAAMNERIFRTSEQC
jgi:integrase